MYKRPILHEESTIFAFSCDLLRAAKVDVHCIDSVLDGFCTSKQRHGVMRAELCDKRTVYSAAFFTVCEVVLRVLSALLLFWLNENLKSVP